MLSKRKAISPASSPRPRKKTTVSKNLAFYDQLVQLNEVGLVTNLEPFECPFCFMEVEKGAGVVLQDCLHKFCKECLAEAIEHSDQTMIKCPFMNEEYSCESHIREREVKKLVSAAMFDKYLQRSLRLAESQAQNSFHCRTPNCAGWCLLEDNVNVFTCPVCRCRNCLTCAAIHEGRDCNQYQDWVALCSNTSDEAIKTRQYPPKLPIYDQLVQLNEFGLVKNPEPFECPVCFMEVAKGKGVVLQDCLHKFCKECLAGAIEHSDQTMIKCPFMDEEYSCESHIREREVKKLVNAAMFRKYLQRSLRLAESQAQNSFHCRTPNCAGWCLLEDNVNVFTCPVCRHSNCLTCAAIHEGRNCKQHQDWVAMWANTSDEANKTRVYLQSMLTKKQAMECPKCKVIVMKKTGCDWLQCTMCKTEICWVTRGPRWGPKGYGDTSGGCKCGVGGVRCHPKCSYCH